MITVEGVLNGQPYAVAIDPPPGTADPDATVGCATGALHVLALLRLHNGRRVEVTPTGPVITLDTGDPASVLAALHGLTQVRRVSGADDLPSPLGRQSPGTVY